MDHMHLICTVDYNLALFSYTGKNNEEELRFINKTRYTERSMYTHNTWRMLPQAEMTDCLFNTFCILYYIILHN